MADFEIPSLARRFLQSPQGADAGKAVVRFCQWMKAKHVIPTGLTLLEVNSFFEQPFHTTISPRTSNYYKRTIIKYLDWLDEQGQLDFDPGQLAIRRKRPLPSLADSFLEGLQATLKPSTCGTYRTVLRRFHVWLEDNRISLKRLRRNHIEQWCLALSDEGLHPSTRSAMLVNIRSYLRWLAEQGELRSYPDDLIRSSDFPKLPTYLPRPLSPEQDAALRARLQASSKPLDQGLLLMRLTGLRIGELMTLPLDCVRVDECDHRFLQVPLGKLNNERLVPIDEHIVSILEHLQRVGEPSARQYLIEDAKGRRVPYADYRDALAEACAEIDSGDKPITSHRLRHTYATSMMTAGMSLTSLMKLLGHRDFRMTLRYADITQETVRTEYFDALPRIESRYRQDLHSVSQATAFEPLKGLSDIRHWIQGHLAREPGHQRVTVSLLKRLQRIEDELQRHIVKSDPNRNSGR